MGRDYAEDQTAGYMMKKSEMMECPAKSFSRMELNKDKVATSHGDAREVLFWKAH